MSEYKSVKIFPGSNGWGDSITVTPTEEKKYVVSMTGGGIDKVALKIAEMTGAKAVDGFNKPVKNENVACAVVNCGGTLRLGIYPKNKIPTVNLNPGGPSGPLAEFCTKELYVSGSTVNNIEFADEKAKVEYEQKEEKVQEKPAVKNPIEEKGGIYTGHMTMEEMWIKSLQNATSKQGSDKENLNILERCASYFVAPIEYSKLLEKGEIKEHAVCFSCEVAGKENGEYVRHIVYYLSTLKEAQKHLPWGSPAVYGTAGGLPIELVLAIGRNKINKVGVKSVGELNMAKEILDALKVRGHIILEKTITPLLNN